MPLPNECFKELQKNPYILKATERRCRPYGDYLKICVNLNRRHVAAIVFRVNAEILRKTALPFWRAAGCRPYGDYLKIRVNLNRRHVAATVFRARRGKNKRKNISHTFFFSTRIISYKRLNINCRQNQICKSHSKSVCSIFNKKMQHLV